MAEEYIPPASSTDNNLFPNTTDKVCTPCLELNLIQDRVVDKFQTCNKCGDLFCQHGSSRLDPQYCSHCCADFTVVDTKETVIREVHNDKGEITSTKNFRIRHITLSGFDWLFHNRAINSLTDLELDHAIEYHRAIFNGMLNERDARFVARIQRNKGKKAGNESKSLLEGNAANPLIQTGEGAKLSISRTTTRTTRVKTVTQSKAPEDPNDAVNKALKTLMSLGLSKEQIAAMSKK